MRETSPITSSGSGVGPRVAPVASAAGMSATTLRERVEAELVRRDMTWSALQRAARASQKTINALKTGDPKREWGHTTLSKFDAVFELEKGTLYAVWKAEPRPADSPINELAEQIELLKAKLVQFEERPPWTAEVIEAMLPLTPEDRSWVVALARRLGSRR